MDPELEALGMYYGAQAEPVANEEAHDPALAFEHAQQQQGQQQDQQPQGAPKPGDQPDGSFVQQFINGPDVAHYRSTPNGQGGYGPAEDLSPPSPALQSQVRTLEDKMDTIRGSPTLSEPRRMDALTNLQRQINRLDPGGRARRNSSLNTESEIDKAIRTRTKVLPEHGLFAALDSKGNWHFQELPQSKHAQQVAKLAQDLQKMQIQQKQHEQRMQQQAELHAQTIKEAKEKHQQDFAELSWKHYSQAREQWQKRQQHAFEQIRKARTEDRMVVDNPASKKGDKLKGWQEGLADMIQQDWTEHQQMFPDAEPQAPAFPRPGHPPGTIMPEQRPNVPAVPASEDEKRDAALQQLKAILTGQ